MGVFEAFEKDVMNAILSESSNELTPITGRTGFGIHIRASAYTDGTAHYFFSR